jgi:6-phosphogluconolactonase
MSDPNFPIEWRIVGDGAAAAAEAAELFVEFAGAAIAARGRALVALAGGSTPRAAYALLASEPRRGRVRWDSIDFFFGDERGVRPGDPDRNDRMAAETLLSKVGIAPGRIHPMPAEREDRDAAADAYATEIRAAAGAAAGPGPGGAAPRFDLVLLGMGPDGHTASLFPGTPALEERARLVVPTRRPEGRWGMTFTFPLLDAARAVVFTAIGEPKAAALRRVIEPGSDPPPAARVRPRGRCVWIVDAALATAAGLAPQGSPGAPRRV